MTSLLVDVPSSPASPDPYGSDYNEDEAEIAIQLIELEDEFEYFDYLTNDAPNMNRGRTTPATSSSDRSRGHNDDLVHQHIRAVERRAGAPAATRGRGANFRGRGRYPARRGKRGGPPPPPPPRPRTRQAPPPYCPLATASDRVTGGLNPSATPFSPSREVFEPVGTLKTGKAAPKQQTVHYLDPADYADSLVPSSSFEVERSFSHRYKPYPFPLEQLAGSEEVKPLRYNLLPEEREGLDDFDLTVPNSGFVEVFNAHQPLDDDLPVTYDKYYQDDNIDTGDDLADVDLALWTSTFQASDETLIDIDMEGARRAPGPSAHQAVDDDDYLQVPNGLDSDEEDLWLLQQGLLPIDKTPEELRESMKRAQLRRGYRPLTPPSTSRPAHSNGRGAVAGVPLRSGTGAAHAPGERAAPAIVGPFVSETTPPPVVGMTGIAIRIPHPNRAFPANRIKAPYEVLLDSPSLVDPLPKHLNPRNDTFQRDILQSWSKAQRQRSDVKVEALLHRLTSIVNSYLAGPGAKTDAAQRRFDVDVFGSVSWGGQTGQSGDLDLVIRDCRLPQGYHPCLWRVRPEESSTATMDSGRNMLPLIRGLPDVYDIHKLARVLRAEGFRDVQAIPGATCPIIKFSDGNFKCDINVNDLGGWYNSRLILAYCEISPYVLRPLIHVLKLWASAKQVNDSSGSSGPPSMSSYCLTLMAIGYLQYLGALPNLQADIDVPVPSLPNDTDDPDLIWAGWGKLQGISVHIGFATKAPPGWRPRDPELTASEAVKGFFSFFSRSNGPANHRFNFATQIVSILNGGIISRVEKLGERAQAAQTARMAGRVLEDDSKEARAIAETRMGTGVSYQPRNWGDRRLIVQDPFIWQKNCTQSMSKAGLDRWWQAVDYSSGSIRASGPRLSLPQFLTPHDPLPVRASTPRGGRGGRGSPMSYGSRGSRGSSRGSRSARG